MDINIVKQMLLIGEKVNLECKEAKSEIPKSLYASYSAFANTNGGTIILGVQEDKNAISQKNRFIITGVENPIKLIEDFWNTINGNKVNENILIDQDVYIVEDQNYKLVIIEIPRACLKITSYWSF